MAKTFEKAVTGFNHNIKYKGKVYHVQTEDSGVNNPHIITHLFVGGNILASKKTSYADIVDAEGLSDLVRQLMEEQHKEMLRNLIAGTYDGDGAQSRHYEPGQLASAEEAAAAAAAQAAHAAVLAQQGPPVLHPAARQVPAGLQTGPRPKELRVETLFGEDLISEKSLDEVILSYLSRDENG